MSSHHLFIQSSFLQLSLAIFLNFPLKGSLMFSFALLILLQTEPNPYLKSWYFVWVWCSVFCLNGNRASKTNSHFLLWSWILMRLLLLTNWSYLTVWYYFYPYFSRKLPTVYAGRQFFSISFTEIGASSTPSVISVSLAQQQSSGWIANKRNLNIMQFFGTLNSVNSAQFCNVFLCCREL